MGKGRALTPRISILGIVPLPASRQTRTGIESGRERRMMVRRCLRGLLAVILLVAIAACQNQTAPREFTPDGAIVKKAIALQLERAQRQISQQLQAPMPRFEIAKVNVDRIDPVIVSNLPTYHLRGNYQLHLYQHSQSRTQKRNPFDLYLQRQSEGETWRLLIKTPQQGNRPEQWASYKVE